MRASHRLRLALNLVNGSTLSGLAVARLGRARLSASCQGGLLTGTGYGLRFLGAIRGRRRVESVRAAGRAGRRRVPRSPASLASPEFRDLKRQSQDAVCGAGFSSRDADFAARYAERLRKNCTASMIGTTKA